MSARSAWSASRACRPHPPVYRVDGQDTGGAIKVYLRNHRFALPHLRGDCVGVAPHRFWHVFGVHGDVLADPALYWHNHKGIRLPHKTSLVITITRLSHTSLYIYTGVAPRKFKRGRTKERKKRRGLGTQRPRRTGTVATDTGACSHSSSTQESEAPQRRNRHGCGLCVIRFVSRSRAGWR